MVISAVQLGYDEVKPKRLSGGELGHLKRNNLPPLRFLREFRAKTVQVKEGDVVKADLFSVGERVDIIGTSKGRGFQGGVKRYHFAGGPKTHGQSDRPPRAGFPRFRDHTGGVSIKVHVGLVIWAMTASLHRT